MPQYVILDNDGDIAALRTAKTPEAALRKAAHDDYLSSDYGPFEVCELGPSAGKFNLKTETVTRFKVEKV